jgi:hypothetical protein
MIAELLSVRCALKHNWPRSIAITGKVNVGGKRDTVAHRDKNIFPDFPGIWVQHV